MAQSQERGMSWAPGEVGGKPTGNNVCNAPCWQGEKAQAHGLREFGGDAGGSLLAQPAAALCIDPVFTEHAPGVTSRDFRGMQNE